MKYIINNAGIVFFVKNKPVKIEKSSAQYARILRVFELPESEQEDALLEIIDPNLNKDGFEVKGLEVFYKGEALPEVLASKVLNLLKEGLPVSLFGKFWDNLKENPSSSSVRELYDFLAYKELPITEDGCFLAYKGLEDDYWSISGNVKTKVVKGSVDKSGRIFNGVGEEIEVVRHDVDDNRNHHCSFGLHIGSLDYASSFGRGKVVVVKVNPKDVVSVPEDCNCQKCRVSAYKVISDFSNEISCAATSEDGEDIVSEDVSNYNSFVSRIESYISKKTAQGYTSLTVKQIQNSFSPDYPSRTRILDALNQLGYIWENNANPVVFI